MSLVTRLLIAAWLVAGALLAGTLFGSGSSHEGDALVELCWSALQIELWLGVLAVVCALLASQRPSQLLGLGPGRLSWRQLGWLALGTLGASHALDAALDLSGLSERSVLGRMPRLLEGTRGQRLGFALLALGLAPGIAEELLCRGLIQRGLARHGPALSILGAALVFGALHVEPIHGAFAALLGVYLGVVAHQGGSTRPAMLCHGANNLAAVLLGAGLGAAPWASEWSVIGGGVLAALCLWAARPLPIRPELATDAAGSLAPPGPPG